MDRAISQRASGRRGVIGRAELYELGVSRHVVDRRLRSGQLHRMHRGVYLVGHTAAPPMAWEAAALLACGLRAVISHQSAAHLWEILPQPSRSEGRPHLLSTRHDVHVTVVGRDPGYKPGIRLHRVSELDRRDVRVIEGLRITSPARTLLDLGSHLTSRGLEQAVAEAHAQRLVNRSALAGVLARYPRRHGAGQLREIVDADAPALTRSEAEERLLAMIREAGLPAPETNVRIGPYEIDFLWRRHGLAVEVDGFAFHSSRMAFERDRERDAYLTVEGLRVIRVTWRKMVGRPAATIALIAGALGIRP